MGSSTSSGFFASKHAVLKVMVLTAIALLNGYAVIMMYANGEYAFALLTLVVAGAGVYIFSTEKAYAHRYIFPGIAAMVIFIIFPLLYTVSIAFTNYSQSNLLTLDFAKEKLTQQTFVPEGTTYKTATAFDFKDNKFKLMLEIDGKKLLSTTIVGITDKEAKHKGLNLSESQIKRVELHVVAEAPDLPTTRKVFFQNRAFMEKLELITPNGERLVKANGMDKFADQRPLFVGVQAGGLILASNEIMADPYALRNEKTGQYLRPCLPNMEMCSNIETGYYYYINDAGKFTSEKITPGFVVDVGWKHFSRVISDEGIRGPFLQIFVWTVLFAAGSVGFTLIIGMVLGSLVQWAELNGRGVYRLLLILPYAIPAFISILIFKGLFNQNFGEINAILQIFFGVSPDWFTDPFNAKAMILIVNTWLGYPYMMILTMGMLKAISDDLYEASSMDGSGFIRNFTNITVPLLIKPMIPLLIASFAFNFNNFVLIQLLTNGGPDILGATPKAGTTDLLVSYTFRLAFEGGNGTDFGLASAIATMIFLLVGALSIINLKLSKADEL